jgi:hypothetical protein
VEVKNPERAFWCARYDNKPPGRIRLGYTDRGKFNSVLMLPYIHHCCWPLVFYSEERDLPSHRTLIDLWR